MGTPEMSPCYQPTARGVPILSISDEAASLPQFEHKTATRHAIDILGRCMGRCQGGWYWSNTAELKDWYVGGEWKIRELHDALCREYYGKP